MALPGEKITVRELQKYIKAKDFKPELKHGYFLKLIEETGELAEAIGRDKRCTGADIEGTIDEELCDVLYYVMALANCYDIDMEKTIVMKEEINSRRYDH